MKREFVFLMSVVFLFSTLFLPASASEEIAKGEAAGWNFTVEDMQIDASLENVSVSLGYTDVQTDDFYAEAEEGKVFCLLKMLIEKDGGTEVIEWDNLILSDENGNEYTRIDDSFLSDLGMMRMPGTALNFGSNEGWIAFEIDEDAAGLTLSYSFEEETFVCDLTEVQADEDDNN